MPIIESLLDADYYNFTMGQFVFEHYPAVQVTYAFRCRTKNVCLGRVISLARLQGELDAVGKLGVTDAELNYLRSLKIFREPFLGFLKRLRLSGYHLGLDANGDIVLTFRGLWAERILWETIALSIITELYGECLIERLTPSERKAVHAAGRLRFMQKIELLRAHPEVKFSDFGTRRRHSFRWQQGVVEIAHCELPNQLTGTSNVYLAMLMGISVIGTSAHQLPMVDAGLLDGEIAERDWLAFSQRRVINWWWERYGSPLSIFLPDTFGTPFFLSNLTEEDLRQWNGFRWDSGDPYVFGEKIISTYGLYGIDAKKKVLVPSDGLTPPVMIGLTDHFSGRINVRHGWGTNLTNDLFDNTWHNGLWYGPLSLVIKPAEANGHGLVKLSDNLDKATGRPEDIARYKIAAGYTNTSRVACTY